MDKREPLISILIPCYNNQQFIYELLESIFAQTYHNLEVLIGDDASQDFNDRQLVNWLTNNRPEWLERISVYRRDINVGTVANLEALQENSEGEYLFNIAADDKLYDETVMQCFVDYVNTLKSKGEKPMVVMAQLEMWDHELKRKLHDFMDKSKIDLLLNGTARELFAESAQKPFLPTQYLYSREYLEKIAVHLETACDFAHITYTL